MDVNLFNGTTFKNAKQILSSKINAFLVIRNFMVSMAAHYATLKNGDVPTKIHISQQQLILEY